MPPKGNRTDQSTSEEPDRGRCEHAWRMFRSALPLFGFWLLIPIAFGVLVWVLYAIQPLVRGVYSSPLSGSLQAGEWEVRFSYPREVTADSSLLFRQAVSIQAVGPAQIPPGEVVVEVEAADERLSLVDEDGRPLPQPLRQVLPTDPTAAPARIHLLGGPSAWGDSASLILRATFPDTSQASHFIQVSVESAWQTALFGLTRAAGIAAWGVLFSAMVGFAVQQWIRMREEQQEEERKRREAMQELEELRELLRQKAYDRALERYQGLEQRGFFPWEESFIRAKIRAIWDNEAPEELQRWGRLCAWKEQAPSEGPIGGSVPVACSEEGQGEAEKEIQAILWAYRFLSQASESAPRVLKEQLEKNPSMLLVAERVLADDVDGRALVRSPEMARVFRGVEEKEDLSQEVIECSRRFQTLQRSPSPWLTLWPGDRAPDLPLVYRGVQVLGLRCNPFGPERAEMDPLLGEYGYRPPAVWGYLSSPQPMVILGSPGSGKTATALLLAYDCQFPPGRPVREEILPVYLFPYESPLPSSDEASCRYLLDQIARAVAEALLQTIARHPYLFTEQNPAGQVATASLWIACLGRGSGENLAPHLLRAGLREEGAGRKVWKEVRKLANAAIMPDETALLEFLREAKPAGFRYTEVLMDWGAEPGGSRGAAIARSMEALLKVVPALAARGVYIKAFLPRTCCPSTVGEPPIPLIELTWSEKDLREMLRRRIEYAGVETGSLQEVYSDVAVVQPDPDAYLVRQAKGSPRSLIRLGNQLLSRVETAPLRPEHLP